MLILCSMTRKIKKNPVALKVLVWSRGRLVTLEILTSSSLSLVEETHGSSGQCVSFPLIDVGSGFIAYCHAERLLHTKQTRGMTITNVVCGLAADSDSVHQADNRLPAMRLRSL